MAGHIWDFQFPRLERVVSGPDAIDALGAELDVRGVTSAVVVTGRTLGASPLLARVLRGLAGRSVTVFTGARQHVPSCTVTELARVIEERRADCVVSFGGGSPIDTSKAAIHSLLPAASGGAGTDEGPLHVAIPTTLSAGEFTSVAGITDENTRVKRAINSRGLVPRVVITDPTLTLETPAWLWAATGVRALDHAVETIYSTHHHPVSDAMAARGLSVLREHLPASLTTAGATQLEHRSWCQVGAWMSVFGMTNAGLGLSHALGHQIGARWDVPHGVTSCITLPHAMRVMAGLAPERFGPIAEGFALSFDAINPSVGAAACADGVAAFIAQFEVPRSLRDARVPGGDVEELAGIVHGIMAGARVCDARITRDHIAALLARAY